MAVPQARRDSYGRPLPELTDARQQVLVDMPANQEGQRTLYALLEEQFHALLRRGTFANVDVRFMVRDGRIQPDIDVTVCKQYRQIQERAQ